MSGLGQALLGLLACNFLLSGCGTTANRDLTPMGLRAPDWKPGYFAEIFISTDVPQQQRDTLTARSKTQIQDILDKMKSIQQGSLAPGCLRRPLNECLASLSQRIAVSDRYPSIKNYVLGTMDINGRPVADKMVNFDGHPPGRRPDIFVDGRETYRFLASVGSDLIVSKLEVFLPADPLRAMSADDYYKTGAFEVVDAIRPAACPLERVAFYQTIENTLKKTQSYSSGRESNGRRHWIESSTRAATVCGMKVEFAEAYGTAAGLRSSINRSGAFGGGTMIVQ